MPVKPAKTTTSQVNLSSQRFNKMDTARDIQLPLSSIRLLVPPVRLISAFMWEVAQQRNVEQYGKLVEFISLVTEMVPELLSSKQRAQLILGLKARLTLDLLQSVDPFDPQAIQDHLKSVQLWTTNSLQEGQEEEVEMSQFVEMVQTLLAHPSEREQFFKEVFPVQYGSRFDTTLQILVWEFFSRLEEFLPVPSFSQIASSLSHSLCDLEQYEQFISDPEDLRILLQHHKQQQKLTKSQLPYNLDAVRSTLASKQTSEVCKDEDEQIVRSRRVGKSRRKAEVPVKRGKDKTEGKILHQENNLAEDNFHGGRFEETDNGQRTWSNVAVEPSYLKQAQELSSLSCIPSPKVSSEMTSGNISHEPSSSESSVKQPMTPQHVSRRKERLPENMIQDSARDEADDSLPLSQKPKCSSAKKAKEHTCLECGKSFKFLSLLKGHYGVHSVVRPFQCNQCDKTFKTEKSLKLHHNVHSEEQPYQCDQCEKRFKSQNGLKLHLQLHTDKASELGEHQKKYTCLQCGKEFGYLSNFRRHSLSVHSEVQPFPCNQCEKRFKTKESLKVHLRSHTGEKPFVCSYCGRRFLSSQVLKSHLRTHTGERPFACTLCDKKFTQSNLLTVHLRMHKKEKPYLCSVCGMSFYHSGALLVHSRTHTGERPHHCDYCGKDYITSTRLAIHLRYHTGERPYPCTQCDKSFHTRSTLKKHTRTHTGERPFQCPKCGKTFAQRSNMKVHLRSHDDSQINVL